MSDEQRSWDQQPGESALWFGRFERYRLMWPHSIVEVYCDEWRKERGKKQEKEGIDSELESDLPKRAPSNWYDTAAQYRWEERAAAWDAAQIAEIEQRVVAEKTKVLLTGYAAMYRRVASLNLTAERLFEMMKDPHKVWLPDVKAIGTGPEAERVDLVQFNAALIHEWRACLDDIAKELGERVKKNETTIKSLPKVYIDLDQDEDGSEE